MSVDKSPCTVPGGAGCKYFSEETPLKLNLEGEALLNEAVISSRASPLSRGVECPPEAEMHQGMQAAVCRVS